VFSSAQRCCSGQSEGAQMGRRSPPRCLLSDRWSVRSNVILLVACRCSAVFLQCSSVLRVADPTDHGLPSCQRICAACPLGLPLLCYYGFQSGTIHVECICGGRDTVALLCNRCCALFPGATLINQWHARGREVPMIILPIW
jgi:hypothetical protein